MFKKINQNGKRLIIIGDVHGCLTKLINSLASVHYDPNKDLLIFTGDFIDRGPENASVLEWVSVLLEKSEAYAVLGNHDDFLVDWADYCHRDQYAHSVDCHVTWMRNGGGWAKEMPVDWLLKQARWLRELPLMLEIELDSGIRAGVVHAELWHPWDIAAANLDKAGVRERAIWGRTKIQQYLRGDLISTTQDIEMVFCGHSVVNTPTLVGNQYYLDTGAVFDTLYNTDVKGAFSFAIISPNSTKPELIKCLTK